MYPILYSFKRIALANKITATDAQGNVILFVQQKLMKVKEKILVYSDPNKTNQLGEINADRVIDFSPVTTFTDMHGQPLLSVKRLGKKSIWRANYQVNNASGETVFEVEEDNVWAKVGDQLFGELPVIGFLSGYIFNPRYNIFDTRKNRVGVIIKQRSLLESSYVMEIPNQSSDPGNLMPLAVLSVLTRERFRG